MSRELAPIRPAAHRRSLVLAALALCAAAGLLVAPPAGASLSTLQANCHTRDALDGTSANGVTLPYRFCDDGVPPTGGTTVNQGAVAAVAVPERYAGVKGLPRKLAAEPGSGADGHGNIALDVDVSLPDPGRFPRPANGYPLLILMHGCCGGNKTGWERATIEPGDAQGWHYSNAWFAARGYVVLTYTARGFVSSDANGNRGSTGQTQIDDARYEVNDLQYLAGLLADDPFFGINPFKVVVTGGSYGGGLSWLTLTDPEWKSPGQHRRMRLAAAAPKFGWTDLVYSLVPNGIAGMRDRLPAFDGSDDSDLLGYAKTSITGALYASGKTGIPPGTGSHATFPPPIDEAITCLDATDLYALSPLCQSTLDSTLPQFIRYRSAYYQNRFFAGLADGSIAPVPLFSAGTFTDPLFTEQEHRRMVERLKGVVPGYPVQEYYGDYQHFTRDKAKEWGDTCGADRHVCRYDDYPGGDLNASPAGLVPGQGQGVTMRLNRFIDHYAAPLGDFDAPQPATDVTAALQVCPDTATDARPNDGAGQRYTAPTFAALAPHTLRLALFGAQTTTSQVVGNPHAVRADPVVNQVINSSGCVVETDAAGFGVATYETTPLPRGYTMIGQTRLTIAHSGESAGVGALQLGARMYDVLPNGRAVLVDRGVRAFRATHPDGSTNLDLQGNGWRFARGHRIRFEIAQDTSPYIHFGTLPSSLTISSVRVRIPVRQPSATL